MPASSRSSRISSGSSGSGFGGAFSPRTRRVILSAVALLSSVPRKSRAISTSAASRRLLGLTFFFILDLHEATSFDAFDEAGLTAPQNVGRDGFQVKDLAALRIKRVKAACTEHCSLATDRPVAYSLRRSCGGNLADVGQCTFGARAKWPEADWARTSWHR